MDIAQKIEIAKNLIQTAQRANQFITVEFIKKTTGELRKMICHRAKVLESMVSQTPSESTLKRKSTLKARNILCVEEFTSDGGHQFRNITLENVTKISTGGKTYQF